MTRELEERLIEAIRADGPMPFAQFVEWALYDVEHGFYATHGQAGGRRGDFLTSVEVGPLFAGVLADWLDGVWESLGKPADFRVAEAGAGVGTLFRGINRAAPACLGALTYTLVERSAAMRVAHQSLPTDRWRSSGELPHDRQHVIVANELLDNLAFDIVERVDGGWAPVYVAVKHSELALTAGERDHLFDYLDGLVPAPVTGTRIPLGLEVAKWIRTAQSMTDRLLVFDYAANTAELATRDQAGWLRTYVGHSRGSNPLVEVGARDITHDVPIDQLPFATSQHSQADWLRSYGLTERVEAARQTWTERGHIGDLQAVAARSAIGEAEALTDPTGLGSFVVLEWQTK